MFYYLFDYLDKQFDFPELVDGVQCFRWININDLSEDDFTFPIDKHVVLKLRKDFMETV